MGVGKYSTTGAPFCSNTKKSPFIPHHCRGGVEVSVHNIDGYFLEWLHVKCLLSLFTADAYVILSRCRVRKPYKSCTLIVINC